MFLKLEILDSISQFSSSMNPLDHLQYSPANAAASAMKYWNGSKQPQLSPNRSGRNDSFQQRINQRKFNSFLSQKDILSENTYEDGIAKDIRELELRIESELEEPNKKMTCAEEVIVSPN